MAGETHSTNKRDPLFDVVKFFAILLVVVGHVFNKGYVAGTPVWFSNFRDEMTMPLFFIVSGYFASRTIENGDWRKLFSHIRSYLQPLFILSLVFTPCFFVFHLLVSGEVMPVVDVLLYPIKRVLFAGWFVWVLSFAYLVSFVCYRPLATSRNSVKVVAFLVIAIGLYFVPALPRGVLNLNYLPLVFPFFALGWLWPSISKNRYDGLIMSLGFVCFAAYLAVVSLGPAEKYGLSMYSGQVYGMDWLTSPSAIIKTVSRTVVGAIGSFGVITVTKLLISCRHIRNLASLGTTSLGVYLLHQWLLDRTIELGILPGGMLCCIIVVATIFFVSHFVVVHTKKHRALIVYLWGGRVRANA